MQIYTKNLNFPRFPREKEGEVMVIINKVLTFAAK